MSSDPPTTSSSTPAGAPQAPASPPGAPKNLGGRPSKLTPAVQEEICRSISAAHVPLKDAALLAGVTYSTLNRWILKGKAQKRGKFRAFCDAVEVARATAKASSLAGIKQAASRNVAPDWKADAWLLERSFQGEYSPRVYVHVEAQLRAAIDRLRLAFLESAKATLTKEEALELAIDALAGDAGQGGTGQATGGEDPSPDSGGGEAVRAPPAEPEAAVVPRADGT